MFLFVCLFAAGEDSRSNKRRHGGQRTEKEYMKSIPFVVRIDQVCNHSSRHDPNKHRKQFLHCIFYRESLSCYFTKEFVVSLMILFCTNQLPSLDVCGNRQLTS